MEMPESNFVLSLVNQPTIFDELDKLLDQGEISYDEACQVLDSVGVADKHSLFEQFIAEVLLEEAS